MNPNYIPMTRRRPSLENIHHSKRRLRIAFENIALMYKADAFQTAIIQKLRFSSTFILFLVNQNFSQIYIR